MSIFDPNLDYGPLADCQRKLAEAQAKVRYYEALARGLSDAEAREEGWPQ